MRFLFDKNFSIAAIFLLASLTSCVSPEEIEAQKVQYCTQLGAPPKSKNYYKCRQELEQKIYVEEQQRQKAWTLQNQKTNDANYCSYSAYDSGNGKGGDFADCMQKLQYYRTNPNASPVYTPQQPHTTTRCRTYSLGADVYTDCN